MLRSGTAIGALVREAKFAQSKADFINKMSIALKEANETKYWLTLLYKTNYLKEKLTSQFQLSNNAINYNNSLTIIEQQIISDGKKTAKGEKIFRYYSNGEDEILKEIDYHCKNI